jgi:polysaccharide export outer membrane protein
VQDQSFVDQRVACPSAAIPDTRTRAQVASAARAAGDAQSFARRLSLSSGSRHFKTGKLRVTARTIIFTAVLAVALAACSAGPRPNAILPVEAAEFRSAQRYQQVYVVAPGDQLEVTVANVPDVSKTLTVRPDGYVSLPKVGDVLVSGMSVPEARVVIAQRFAQRLTEPDVSIAIANPRPETAFVMGEVGRPSAVPVREARTVAQALALAGGPTRAASITGVALIRLDDSGRLVATMLDNGGMGSTGSYLRMQATPLRNGDIVLVPESGRSKFARFIQDFVSTPLGGLNQLMSPYVQLRLLQEIN